MSTSESRERLQCRMTYISIRMGVHSDIIRTPFCGEDILCTHVRTYVCARG